MAILDVIARFGGIRQMADKLGHRNHTTVQGWANRGLIPARHQHEILCVARDLGIEVEAADLIPDPADAQVSA